MAAPPTDGRTIELPVAGMDCADCVAHVEHAVRGLPGVRDVRVVGA